VRTPWLLAQLLPVTHDRRQFIQLFADDAFRGRDHLILVILEGRRDLQTRIEIRVGHLQVVSDGLGLASLQNDRLSHLLQKERRDDAKNSNNAVRNFNFDI
jgi:hypothetical protein